MRHVNWCQGWLHVGCADLSRQCRDREPFLGARRGRWEPFTQPKKPTLNDRGSKSRAVYSSARIWSSIGMDCLMDRCYCSLGLVTQTSWSLVPFLIFGQERGSPWLTFVHGWKIRRLRTEIGKLLPTSKRPKRKATAIRHLQSFSALYSLSIYGVPGVSSMI